MAKKVAKAIKEEDTKVINMKKIIKTMPANPKVVVKEPFYDLQARKDRKVGEEFETTKDRAKELEKLDFITVL